MKLIDSALFAGLSPSALNDILGRMTARGYTANQYICREGDTSDHMYLLESGVVEVIIGESSAAQVIAHLRRGDIFGEMGLLTDEPRAASILTAMPTLVLQLGRSAFTEIIHLYPAILLNISRVLIERQRKSLRSLVRSRRSEFILLMIGRGTEKSGTTNHCDLPKHLPPRLHGYRSFRWALSGQNSPGGQNGRLCNGPSR